MPAGRDLSLKRLKQRGFLLFHTTTGSSIFSPSSIDKKSYGEYLCGFFATIGFFSFFN